MSLQRTLLLLLVISSLTIALASAATTYWPRDQQASDPLPADFNAHVLASRTSLLSNRRFQSEDKERELEWNMPFELRPANSSPRKAILLVHGLGDSPWSFVDIAHKLASEGYVVRTVLLAGHGTKPEDLINVRLEEWQALLREQVSTLHAEFPEVYLGGFSTGANLVLERAMEDRDIRGLVLFSPAFRSNEALDWTTPLLSRFKTWLFSPTSGAQQSPLRYYNVPTNGFAQFYRSSLAARRSIKREPFDRPAVLIMTEHDSVVDVAYVRRMFGSRFINPSSRLIWYGASGDASDLASSRLLVRPDHLPQDRISQFSHMSILFSPENELYGRDGSQRVCLNGQTEDDTARCMKGEEVWYSDWGLQEPGKIHARLTFNPYFDWQWGVIQETLASAQGSFEATRLDRNDGHTGQQPADAPMNADAQCE